MSNVAIEVEGLSKLYRVKGPQARSDTFRDALVEAGRAALRAGEMIAGRHSTKAAAITTDDEFWALKDVSFKVKWGDAIGVIGRNGAGKSTLLKVLSRITEPTAGRATIHGRIAALLEVGTGFHPELTGRENVYLNGAILGMSRAEIRRKFDEIVEFAGVERFLETPVKRYSSGMYVRLAFSIAAHLEPEILIVDEVLAVGDAEFQRKCLGKMEDVAGEGRTVLFVSHNLAAIRRICTRGVYLMQGRADGDDNIDTVMSKYTKTNFDSIGLSDHVTAKECDLSLAYVGGGLIKVSGRSDHATEPNFTVGAALEAFDGSYVMETGSADHFDSARLATREFEFEFHVPLDQLRPGQYIVKSYAYLHNEAWLIGKDDGPRIKLSAPEQIEGSLIYLERPPGYGPVIPWRTVHRTAADGARV